MLKDLELILQEQIMIQEKHSLMLAFSW